MRKFMLVVLAAALPGCSGMSGAVGPAVDGDPQLNQGPYEIGKAYFAHKQYGLALAEFRKSLRQHPRAPRELNAVAAVYDQMLRFDLADRYYQLALSIEPNSVQTLNNLGYSHYRRSQEGYGVENLATARAYLARASALAGDHPVVVANLDIVSAAVGETGDRDADVAVSVAGVRVAERDPYESWIERTGPASVLVVTNPDPATTALARSLGVLPQIAAVTKGDSTKIDRDPESAHPASAAPVAPAACQAPQCVSQQPPLGPYLHEARPIAGSQVDAPAAKYVEVAALGELAGEFVAVGNYQLER